MKNRNYSCLFVFVASLLFLTFTSSTAHAAVPGVPVFDATHFTAWVERVVTRVKEWKAITENHIRSYETLKTLGNRMQTYKGLSNDDISKAMEVLEPYLGKEKLNFLLYLNPSDPDFESLIKLVLEDDMGHSVESFEDLEPIIASFEGNPDKYRAEIERTEYTQKLYIDEIAKAAEASKESKNRGKAISTYGTTLKELEPESELATLQLSAGELHMAIQQNQEIILALRSLAVSSKHAEMQQASVISNERRNQLELLSSRHNIHFSPRSGGDPTVNQ